MAVEKVKTMEPYRRTISTTGSMIEEEADAGIMMGLGARVEAVEKAET
jgi:hypothetical protein